MPKLYSTDHEWIEINGNKGVVGISDFAQGELGDIVYVDMPEVGTSLSKGARVADIESVKTVSEIYMIVSGTVTRINTELEAHPERVNDAAESGGWILEIELGADANLEGLLDEAGYQQHLAGLG